MRHHSARSFVAGRIWACLLLSFLGCGSPSLGYADETIDPTKEVRDVLGQAVQAAVQVTNPFFRAKIIDPIASVYAEIGNLERALELAGMKDNVNNNGTLLAITQVLVKQGHSKQAADIASRIDDGYWKASALEELGRYHGSKGENEAAIERYKQALKAAASIDDSYSRVHTMLRIAEAQVAEGDIAKAGETLQQVLEFSSGIQDAESRDSAIGDVVRIQAKSGDVSGALQTLDRVQDADQKEGGLRNIVSEVARRGNIPYAMELAASIKDEFDHDFALQRIAEAQTNDGDFEGALATVNSIRRSKSSKIWALGWIADKLVERLDRVRAQPVLKQAAQVASQISDVRERARYLGGIARRQAEANDGQGAVDSIRQAIRSIDEVSDMKERNGPLLSLAEAQVQMGDIAGALKSAGAMSSDFYQDRAYFQIAVSQARLGDMQGALQTAATSHGYEFMWRGYSLQRIAEIQVNKGDKKGALAWAVTQAVPSDRALALLGVADGLLHKGKPIDNYRITLDF
jgi:predicted negative regulator of RcsB-dependent stress response